MKIALLGYGKMGKSIEKLGLEMGHSFPLKIDVSNASKLNEKNIKNCDVAIEFSTPEMAFHHIQFCLEVGVPIVCGTTGWLQKKSEIDRLCQEKRGSFLYASNFSLGVNLFFEFADYISKRMKHFEEYNISIIENHHTEKKDKPSGTAITAAEIVLRNTKYQTWQLVDDDGHHKNEQHLPMTSIREAGVVGDHDIIFSSEIDKIVLSHSAFSRDGFALGAIKAAEYIHNKKGIFTMAEVLKN